MHILKLKFLKLPFFLLLLLIEPAAADTNLIFFPRYSYSVFEVYDAINLKLLVVSSNLDIGGDLQINYNWNDKSLLWLRLGLWYVTWIEPPDYTIVNTSGSIVSFTLGFSHNLNKKLQYTISASELQTPVILYAGGTSSQIGYPYWFMPSAGLTYRFLQLGPVAFKTKVQAGLFLVTTSPFSGNLNYWVGTSTWLDFQAGKWGIVLGGYFHGDHLNAGNYTQSKTEIGLRLGFSLNLSNCGRCARPTVDLNRSY